MDRWSAVRPSRTDPTNPAFMKSFFALFLAIIFVVMLFGNAHDDRTAQERYGAHHVTTSRSGGHHAATPRCCAVTTPTTFAKNRFEIKLSLN